jgi:serine/threonine protein kinase
MAFYPDGNIADADIADQDDYVTAFGQVLDGLKHLHGVKIAHRDLKPENLLVQKNPVFKVAIADFSLSKIATDATVLMTFCGTLKYMAPEVFPGNRLDYGLAVDVWSLGVIVLEWVYGIPEPGRRPAEDQAQATQNQWRSWIGDWSGRLLGVLEDQDDDRLTGILKRMVVVDPEERQCAVRCLEQGSGDGMWRRRDLDGLVVCASSSSVGCQRARASTAGPSSTADPSDATVLPGRSRRSAAPSISEIAAVAPGIA